MTALVRGVIAAPHRLGRQAEGVRVDVAEDGARAGGRDRFGACVERERRDDHVVARPEIQRP
jgi:hypothetical protein